MEKYRIHRLPEHSSKALTVKINLPVRELRDNIAPRMSYRISHIPQSTVHVKYYTVELIIIIIAHYLHLFSPFSFHL